MTLPPSEPHGPDAPRTPPACPWHPGRAAYVPCADCARPVCLECQRPGPGGVVLCPDCAARAAEDAVSPAAAARAPSAPARRASATPLTWILLVLTVLAYGGQWLTRASAVGVTERLWYAGAYTSPLGLEPWRMLTYAFVHDTSGPTHLALNMLALWMIGRVLEPLLGTWRFLSLYLVSAVGGAVVALWTTDPLQPVVGASGAVYGLFAALFVLTRVSGGQVGSIAVLIGVNLAASFLLPGISWQVHVGGLITGALLGVLFTTAGGLARGRAPTPETAGLHAAGVVAVLAVCAALTALGAARVSVPGLTG